MRVEVVLQTDVYGLDRVDGDDAAFWAVVKSHGAGDAAA